LRYPADPEHPDRSGAASMAGFLMGMMGMLFGPVFIDAVIGHDGGSPKGVFAAAAIIGMSALGFVAGPLVKSKGGDKRGYISTGFSLLGIAGMVFAAAAHSTGGLLVALAATISGVLFSSSIGAGAQQAWTALKVKWTSKDGQSTDSRPANGETASKPRELNADGRIFGTLSGGLIGIAAAVSLFHFTLLAPSAGLAGLVLGYVVGGRLPTEPLKSASAGTFKGFMIGFAAALLFSLAIPAMIYAPLAGALIGSILGAISGPAPTRPALSTAAASVLEPTISRAVASAAAADPASSNDPLLASLIETPRKYRVVAADYGSLEVGAVSTESEGEQAVALAGWIELGTFRFTNPSDSALAYDYWYIGPPQNTAKSGREYSFEREGTASGGVRMKGTITVTALDGDGRKVHVRFDRTDLDTGKKSYFVAESE
jgi:hypothetical protein